MSIPLPFFLLQGHPDRVGQPADDVRNFVQEKNNEGLEYAVPGFFLQHFIQDRVNLDVGIPFFTDSPVGKGC